MKVPLFILPIFAITLFLTGFFGNFIPSTNIKAKPVLTLQTSEGKTISFEELQNTTFKGKWVLLDFWASWNSKSLEDRGVLHRIYSKYQFKNLEIVSFSLDNLEERWKKAVLSNHSAWLEISDLKGWKSVACSKYKVSTLPYHILINPSGKVVRTDIPRQNLEKVLSETL